MLELIQCPMLFFSINFDGDKLGVFSSLYRVFVVNFHIFKIIFFIILFAGCFFFSVIVAFVYSLNLFALTVVFRFSDLVYSFAKIIATSIFWGG